MELQVGGRWGQSAKDVAACEWNLREDGGGGGVRIEWLRESHRPTRCRKKCGAREPQPGSVTTCSLREGNFETVKPKPQLLEQLCGSDNILELRQLQTSASSPICHGAAMRLETHDGSFRQMAWHVSRDCLASPPSLLLSALRSPPVVAIQRICPARY